MQGVAQGGRGVCLSSGLRCEGDLLEVGDIATLQGYGEGRRGEACGDIVGIVSVVGSFATCTDIAQIEVPIDDRSDIHTLAEGRRGA